MTTLRVRLESAPEPARADPWVLVDGQGRVIASGIDPPPRWPAADRRVAVLAAAVVRVVSLPLPPLPAARIAAAAAYALEDRLATSLDDAVIAVAARRGTEPVVAVVASRALVAALAAAQPRFDRAVAEPQLAPAAQGWSWIASTTGGFVRDGDGGAFAVGAVADPALPAELATALRQAARAGAAPERVVAHRPADAALLAAWTREGGVPFVAGTSWQWAAAPSAAIDAAIDLMAPMRSARVVQVRREASLLPAALALLLLVGGLHLAATAGTWIWQRVDLARTQRTLAAIAREMGGAVPADIARLHAEARHRSGRAAPADALPLFARAAPALAGLPAGTLRTASYAQGAWTLELAKVDDAVLDALRDRAAAAGLDVVHARTADGVRARIGVVR